VHGFHLRLNFGQPRSRHVAGQYGLRSGGKIPGFDVPEVMHLQAFGDIAQYVARRRPLVQIESGGDRLNEDLVVHEAGSLQPQGDLRRFQAVLESDFVNFCGRRRRW
jgi:hypothetical protein